MILTEQLTHHFGGKTVLLTGAASGIGRALALRLAAAGVCVHAVDANREGLESLREEAGEKGKVVPCVLDVRDVEGFAELVTRVHEETQRIDFLFNNAGVTLLGEAHKIPFERWKWLLDINLMGVVHGVLPVYPIMIRQGGGHIINTASIAGVTGYATAAAYTASKAAVLELTRSLRSEARLYGVKVSAACPGYVDSGIFVQERVVGADLDDVMRDLPVAMMTPDEAACHLLRGVIAGKETIVFPFTARFLWNFSNWAPSVVGLLQKRFLRAFQAS
jgi:NADP-dependent 3-hydroxy acid dehydrogenase YdfG